MAGLGLSLGMGMSRSSGAPFDPASLFAASEQGFIFDFTDASTLYQNAGGTTPVAAASDPVRYVADLSGNNNHAANGDGVPATWSAEGVVAAGSNYLERVPAVDLSGASAVTLVLAVKTAASGTQFAFIQGNPNSNALYANVNSSLGNIWAATANLGGGAAGASNSRASNDGEFHIVTVIAEVGQSVIVRVDGEEYSTSPSGTVSSPFLNAGFVILTNQIGGQGLVGTCAFQTLISRKLSVSELYQIERHAGSLAGLDIISEIPPAGAAYYNMIDTFGQSLSVGVSALPVLSTTTRFNDEMFVGGVLTPFDDRTALTPLIEATETISGSDCGETPVSGMAEMLHELGYANPFIGAAEGFPATAIGSIITSLTGDTSQIVPTCIQAWRRAREQFKHFKVRAVPWLQGESDGGNASYAADLNTLRGLLDTKIASAISQPENIWLLSYQLDTPEIGLQHLSASDDYDYIRVAFPAYFIAHAVDNVHLSNVGSKVAGAYFGLAYKAIIVDGDTNWQPLRIQSHLRSGSTLDVTYNPVGALALDTTTVASQTNSGFRLFDTDGITAITINSVALLDSDTVRITAATSIPAGAILRVGFSDPTSHDEKIKTNLRDSQGDTIIFDGGGLDYPMHNWAVAEQLTLV